MGLPVLRREDKGRRLRILWGAEAMRKKWILIGVGAFVLIGAIASAGRSGKDKSADVAITTEAPAAVTATVAPTAAPKATPKPTAKPTATPKLTAAPTEAPVQTLGPVQADAPASDRSAPSETPAPKQYEYVLNTSSKKFHYPSCKSVKDMKDSNRKDFTGTRDEVIAMGYDPCGNCHP